MNPVAIVMPTAGIYDAKKTMGQAMATALVPGGVLPIISPDDAVTGFTATVNRGFAQVPDGYDVAVLNDDVLGFSLGWLQRLQAALYSREDIGLIGPSGDCSTSPMKDAPGGGEGMISVGWFPFWCALIRAQAFRQVGHLNPAYIHYSSDYDYCDRLREANWKVVWFREVVLKHDSGGSGKRKAWAGHDLSLYMNKMKQKRRRGQWADTVPLS